MGTLQEDLLHPSGYPGARPSSVGYLETHISRVYLLEHEVYKIKKPVDCGFLDFTTLERRREACEAEVRLNRRLAPGVYLGVVPVLRGADGRHWIGRSFEGSARVRGELQDEEPGELVEWAVHMRRLPEEVRADRLLVAGGLDADRVEEIAVVLARFHAACRADADTARYGEPDRIRVNVCENFAQAHPVAEGYLTQAEEDEIEGGQLGFLKERAGLLKERIAAGRIRDGHGDLRLEHLYLRPEGLVAIDCIEFNERFRFADVAADLAFLSMDLAACGRVDLAEHLLAAYAQESNDYDLYAVVDFYESYRAYVRAKIAAMIAADPEAPRATRSAAAEQARRHFLLALAAERSALTPPVVVAVGGIIASGKSTLAARLSRLLGAPVVEADRTRKSLLGVEATRRITEGSWSGAYDKGFTERVYQEVLRRGRVVLDSGRPVILDASFRAAHLRQDARGLARQLGVPFLFVECRTPPETCRARLQARQTQAGSVSDARVEIFDDFVRAWEPVAELDPSEHLVVDTARGEVEVERALKGRLPRWPTPAGVPELSPGAAPRRFA